MKRPKEPLKPRLNLDAIDLLDVIQEEGSVMSFDSDVLSPKDDQTASPGVSYTS